MTNHTDKTIEEALTMYAETVSPSKDVLLSILQQIPEKKEEVRRAIRSPYRWKTFAEVVTVFAVLLVLYPALPTTTPRSLSFYQVDEQIQQFEQQINAEDQAMLASHYAL